MLLSRMTWQQVDAHVKSGGGIVLPMGSTEQHGPMGMIGTDTICAQALAERAADICGAICAPPLAYTPAPFNMGFAGTMSLSADLFQAMARELLEGLQSQGFTRIYVVNGHGANLAPMRTAATGLTARVQIRSWWDFEPVNLLRRQWYGAWEGMHATPSEIAITQSLFHVLPTGDAADPPKQLSAEFIAAHAGDRHGPPQEHRAQFPDGRVGSHSALACPEHGDALIAAATQAIAEDMRGFFNLEG
ncbi:creatininase family protein [Rhodobacteraceae bacterium M382]|nr:creatininase family protein [Rhodobacteraceae bacterium M382]